MEENQTNWTEVACGSAASSWSGYTYQGKVAIYTALCYLNEIGIKNKEIDKYSLEIEWFEDFCIKFNNEYFSIHQVKSNQDKETIGSYKANTLELLGKVLIEPTIGEASLHTAVKIKDFCEEQLKEDLKAYIPSKKISLLTYFKHLLFCKKNFDEAFNKLKVNEDSGEIPFKRIIALDEINEEIIEQLITFYNTQMESSDFQTNCIENINHVFSNLIHSVNKLISGIHDKSIDNPTITFTEIIDILINDRVFDISNKTVSSLLMDDLMSYFEDYCQNEGLDLADDEEAAQIWNYYLDIFKLLTDDDFILLCRKISPSISIKKSKSIDIQEYKRLLDQYGVKNILIGCLFSYHHLLKDSSNKNDLLIIKNNKMNHLITLIMDEGKNAVTSVGNKIFQNLSKDRELFEMLYEVGTYLNKNLEGEYQGTITDVEFEMGEVSIKKEKYTLPKRIQFMNMITAMEEFPKNGQDN
jgi:hypothetical protein